MNIIECNGTIPNNIEKLIRQKGLKQYAVAEKAGISRRKFSDMLNGRTIIKINDLIAISSALNVPVENLFFDTNTSKNGIKNPL